MLHFFDIRQIMALFGQILRQKVVRGSCLLLTLHPKKGATPLLGNRKKTVFIIIGITIKRITGRGMVWGNMLKAF